ARGIRGGGGCLVGHGAEAHRGTAALAGTGIRLAVHLPAGDQGALDRNFAVEPGLAGDGGGDVRPMGQRAERRARSLRSRLDGGDDARRDRILRLGPEQGPGRIRELTRKPCWKSGTSPRSSPTATISWQAASAMPASRCHPEPSSRFWGRAAAARPPPSVALRVWSGPTAAMSASKTGCCSTASATSPCP